LDSLSTKDLIAKVKLNSKIFDGQISKIQKQISDYDIMVQTEKLLQLNMANMMTDKKSVSRRQSQAQNQGTRSLSIQKGSGRGVSAQPRGARGRSDARKNRSMSKAEKKGRRGRGQNDKNCKVM
jgi:hypothetical protein